MPLSAELTQLIHNYEAGFATIKQAISGMSREQLLARPVPGKMSTMEVLCHISDFEPVYAERMKRVLTMENASLLGADQDEFLKKLAYQERDVVEELNVIESTRKQLARILKTLTEADFQRVGTHNERGPLSLRKLLENITNHIPHHVPFIHEKRKALGV